MSESIMFLQDKSFCVIMAGADQMNIQQLAKLERLMELKTIITMDHNYELTKEFIKEYLDLADDIRARQKVRAIDSWKNVTAKGYSAVR